MNKREEEQTIKRKARQLKELVGVALSLDECESFIHSTISDYLQGQKTFLQKTEKSQKP